MSNETTIDSAQQSLTGDTPRGQLTLEAAIGHDGGEDDE